MKLTEFIKGWLVGNFDPSLYKTNQIEVAIKRYKSGDIEKEHYHKIATEYTIIIDGKVKMLDTIYEKDDIVIIQPMQSNQFHCIEDSTLLVIKTPSSTGDKYEY